MSEKSEKKSESKKCLHPIISCLLTAIFTSIYVLGIWSGLTLKSVNMLCLPLFFLELTLGLIEDINKKKASFLLAATFISTIVGALNLWSDNQTIGEFRLSGLSGWSIIWTILLFIAFFSALVILIRLLLWRQEHWEEYRKSRQEHRLQNKLTLFEYLSSQNKHRLAMQAMDQNYQQQLAENKWQDKIDRQKIKHQSRKEQLKSKEASNKDNENNRHSHIIQDVFPIWFNWEIYEKVLKLFGSLLASALRWIFLLLIIAGFFLFPYINSLKNGISSWLKNVEEIAKSLRKNSEFVGGQSQALIYYIFFYITAVVTLYIAVYLIILVLKRKSQQEEVKEQSFAHFLVTYQLPIALLIVFGAFLYILTDGESSLSKITGGWTALFLIILFILILFTAVEIVRLVIAQCAIPNSLLKKLIYLIFMAILKFLSELLLGVIINFRIQMIISSLFEVFFPKTDEAENLFNNRLNRKLEQLFNKSITNIGNDFDASSASQKFHRKKIWRRRKK